MKQKAYARRIWGAKGSNKAQIALDVGYSRFSAASPKSKIEDKKGYQNEVIKLAKESNNLALSAMAEFKARGFTDFTNRDLVGALNAIGSAWKAFNTGNQPKEENQDNGKNKLRTVILQRIENQTVNTNEVPAIATPQAVEEVEEEVKDNLDF